MNRNTFSPSMTLAGMDYIAPSAACIKPTMMRTQQSSSEVSHAVGRHTHNDSDINSNRKIQVNMEVRGSKALPTQPEIIKITLQDCLACSGCVTTAETILVNAQSRKELLRTRAEQWNRANNTDVDTSVKSSEFVSDANAPNATHNTTGNIAHTRNDDNGKEVHTNKSSMPPWLITISEQSASSIAAYLSCSVTEAYKIIAGFMYHVLTHHVSKSTNLHDINEKTNANLIDDITITDRNSSNNSSLDTCTNVKDSSFVEGKEINNDSHHFSNTDTRLHTQINECSCEHEAGHGAIYVSDLRWASRLSSQKTSEEYERRLNSRNAECPLPLLVSACPGWVCYCEKQGATLLPHLCPVLSPQGLAGSLAKRLLGPNVYHVSVQPCFDRKLEAARDHVQWLELIRDYNAFCQKGKAIINKFKSELSSAYHQQEEEEEEEQYQEEELKQIKLEQRESVMQNTEKNNNVINQQSSRITPYEITNTASGIAKIENIKNNNDDSKTEGEADCTVYCTDCVISTLELLEWMCEVDPTFPWRRELNSIDDVEDESEYKSLLFAASAPEPEEVQSIKEEEEEKLENNNINKSCSSCNDNSNAPGNSSQHNSLQHEHDTIHENKNSLSTNEMNVCDDKLISSSTESKAKVQENTEEIALWEGSGGYHRHVIQYMLRKELNKRTSTSVKYTLQTGEEVSEEQEHSNIDNKADSKEEAAHRCAVDESMKSVRYEIKRNRNHQLITTPLLPKQTFCIAYGFQQIQNIVRGLRKRLPTVRSYTFVEMMACPEGCLNGGGQIRSKEKCNSSTTERSFDEHEQFFTATKRAFAEHITEKVVQSNNANYKTKSIINTQIIHNTKCKAKSTNANNTISEAESDVSNGNIRNNNTSINQNCKIRKIERHRVESDAGTLILFSFAGMSKFAEECGPASWLCKFTDRQKEFEQMLNEGNLQSLKW